MEILNLRKCPLRKVFAENQYQAASKFNISSSQKPFFSITVKNGQFPEAKDDTINSTLAFCCR